MRLFPFPLRPDRSRLAQAACAMALLAAAAHAHDFWIEPSTFRPAVGTPVQVHLRVGERFAGEGVPRNPARIERFSVVYLGAESELPGRGGMAPAGVTVPAAAGPHWLLYQSRASFLELEPEAFEAYLREEGLESIVAERARRGESGRPGKEAFFRGAKALLCAGDEQGAASPAAAGPLGGDRGGMLSLAVEIVADSDLCAARAGARPSFRVLFRGQGVAGALVVALNRDDPQARLAARSDDAGRIELPLDRPGAWLVKAVHMIRADEGADADWESYWASLTFELPAP